MAQTIDQFITRWNNRLINNGGTQCVAVPNQYNRDVIEGGWIGTPVTGYAIDWYDQFGRDPDYNNYIQVAANQPAQKGDIAVWRKYPSSGLPHIAVVIEVVGPALRCLTQNPGPAHIEDLTKTGLAGYLRPKKFIKAAPTPSVVLASTTPSAGKVFLPGTVNSWRLYKENGPYIRGHEIAFLNPAQYGGLTYDIVGRPAPNVVTIQTKMFGRGSLYVGPDTPAQFK